MFGRNGDRCECVCVWGGGGRGGGRGAAAGVGGGVVGGLEGKVSFGMFPWVRDAEGVSCDAM